MAFQGDLSSRREDFKQSRQPQGEGENPLPVCEPEAPQNTNQSGQRRLLEVAGRNEYDWASGFVLRGRNVASSIPLAKPFLEAHASPLLLSVRKNCGGAASPASPVPLPGRGRASVAFARTSQRFGLGKYTCGSHASNRATTRAMLKVSARPTRIHLAP